ncbi:MAG TPA: hypothetical protein VGF19_06455, partial [Candidatus Acidoferrum sp.]
NFARPFQSTNPSIFWTRWHMSLSFWIRDYVFLPLAMMRREVWWRNLALVISMVLFGLWHRASVLFLVWGCYHGVLLVLHRQVQQAVRTFDWDPPAFWTPLSWIATMALINLGWIFFRANSLPQARQMLLGGGIASELRFALSERKPLCAGGGAGAGIRDRTVGNRRAQSFLACAAKHRSRLGDRNYRSYGSLALVLDPAALRAGIAFPSDRDPHARGQHSAVYVQQVLDFGLEPLYPRAIHNLLDHAQGYCYNGAVQTNAQHIF